jgi:hypothetical protein
MKPSLWRWTTTRIALLSMLVAPLVAVWPSPAQAATFVSSVCRERGPVNGDRVNVCVRLYTYSCPDSPDLCVAGYGALDHIAGSHASSVRLRVESLDIRAYYPIDGPEQVRITSGGAVGYGYINATSEGFSVVCGYGYKAVMTYGIRWSDGSLTRQTNFYTPPGTNRWSFSC